MHYDYKQGKSVAVQWGCKPPPEAKVSSKMDSCPHLLPFVSNVQDSIDVVKTIFHDVTTHTSTPERTGRGREAVTLVTSREV